MTVYPPQPQQKSFLRDLVEIVVLALVLYIVITFAVQTVHVMGTSMVPTLGDNDFLIASKISYHIHDPQRGDIVIFKPTNELAAGSGGKDYIKRIIGVPGDHLRIVHAQVFINGHLLKEPYLNEVWTWTDTYNGGQEFVLATGQYFVMGDNRNHSTDSRFLGPQNKDQFLGKAWVRIWPLSTFKIFGNQMTFAN
jgi:signal peptidase I